jgi:hypothetical protein
MTRSRTAGAVPSAKRLVDHGHELVTPTSCRLATPPRVARFPIAAGALAGVIFGLLSRSLTSGAGFAVVICVILVVSSDARADRT